jgi:hypothetical protein
MMRGNLKKHDVGVPFGGMMFVTKYFETGV